jgi:phage terminase large subunit-like protein
MTPWNLAAPDWEARLRAGKSLVPDLPLDQRCADRAVAAFDKLRLADVPGNPRLRDACGDWFRDIVRAMHGSLDPLTGERRIREIFCLVPKKNSKTSYGAGLMLVSLLLNERPKAAFLLVAPTQDVAELAYSQIEGMIRLDEELAALLHVQRHLKRVTDRRTGATLEVLSFDPAVLTGQKPAGILLDELHVVGSVAKAASAIGQLRGGMIAYPESFFVFITTQSEKPPAGVFRAELMKARAIRDGRASGRMLPVLYEFPPAIANDRAAWKDPANWPMVTPNRGRSITIERLIEDFETAQQSGDDELARWASQHLNLEIGIALQSDRWVGADYWAGRADLELTLDELIERSEVVCVGIDGGGADDLLGLAVLGRDKDTREWLLWNRAWAHASVLERRKSEVARLQDFARDGSLVIVDRYPDDLIEVADLVAQIDARGVLGQVGLDQIGIGGIVDALAERGIENVEGRQRVLGISQGWKLAGAIKTAERKLIDGTLIHAGQPLMAWCVGNARVEPRGNALMITKQAAGTAKIDPLIATFNAVALMATNPEALMPRSVYEGRGLLII